MKNIKNIKRAERRIASFVLSIILVVSCIFIKWPVLDTYADQTLTGTYYYDLAARILDMVNQERSAAGLKPLTMDADLQAAAMIRSVETTIRFEHTRPNGAVWFSACDKSYGENIGQNTGFADPAYASMYGDGTGSSGWMNSLEHKKNIMNSEFVSIGIGVFKNSRGTYYCTQEFGPGVAEGPLHPLTQEAVSITFDDRGSIVTGQTPPPTAPAPTTAAPTTVAPTTPAPTTVAPTTATPTKPTPTKPAPTTASENATKPVQTTQDPVAASKEAESIHAAKTPKNISVKLAQATYPIGYTLTSADFIITVTYEDGHRATNPSGWNASPLKVSENTPITLSYGGLSTTVKVNTIEATHPEGPGSETTIKETTKKPSDSETTDVDEPTSSDETPEEETGEADTSDEADGYSVNTDAFSELEQVQADEASGTSFTELFSSENGEYTFGIFSQATPEGEIIESILGIKIDDSIYKMSQESLIAFLKDNKLADTIYNESTATDVDVDSIVASPIYSFKIDSVKHDIYISDNECSWFVTDSKQVYAYIDNAKLPTETEEETTVEDSSDTEDIIASDSIDKEITNAVDLVETESSASTEAITTSEATAETTSDSNSNDSLQKILIGAIIGVAVLLFIIIILLIIILCKKSKDNKEAESKPAEIEKAEAENTKTKTAEPEETEEKADEPVKAEPEVNEEKAEDKSPEPETTETDAEKPSEKAPVADKNDSSKSNNKITVEVKTNNNTNNRNNNRNNNRTNKNKNSRKRNGK